MQIRDIAFIEEIKNDPKVGILGGSGGEKAFSKLFIPEELKENLKGKLKNWLDQRPNKPWQKEAPCYCITAPCDCDPYPDYPSTSII